MFKAARWRNEKNKIKVVFKLQFQASQIPQGKWDALVVSLIPLDVGKPTARSEKAAVYNGGCQWEKPIYETVKFVQEPKTGRINDKIYHIHVSATGSPKAAILGEATIDFADYAEGIKPSSVSLPLEVSESSALLHVTIHRMQDEVNGREIEENVDKAVKPQTRTLKSQLNNYDRVEDHKIPSGINSIIATEKPSINGEVRIKFPSSRAMVLHAESNVNLQKSSSFDALSPSGSDISSGRYTPRENKPKNGNIHQDSASLLSPLSNNPTPRSPIPNATDSPSNYGDHRRSNTEWSASSAPDGSVDGFTNSSDEALRERMQCSNDSTDKLINDVVALERQVDVSELELQALRKQVVKERRQVEDLSRDLCSTREERNTLRRELEQLKASQEKDVNGKVSAGPQFDGNDLRSILQEIKQELDHEKNLNSNLRLQLQKTQESNSELILAVRDLDEMLEQKNREISCAKCNHMADKPAKIDNYQGKIHVNGFTHLQHSERPCETQLVEEEDDEQYALEVLVKEHDMKMTFSLEQKITELNNEIEVHRKDREELEMQMEQLALDYEIMKQENHDITLRLEQTQLREQLRMQYECSAHLSIINELEAQVENLERELEKQAEAFEADLASLTYAKVEREKRAIQLEEALRMVRWKNVNTAEHLKEELESLSMQMSSAFSKNEKLAMQALAEAGELCLRNSQLEQKLEKANLELVSAQNHFRVQFEDFATEVDLSRRQVEQLNMKLKDKSEELENQKKSEAEKENAFSEEMLKLHAYIELLEREKNDIYQRLKQKDDANSHVEQLKTAIKESEMLLQNINMERDILQRECAIMKEETKKLSEELDDLRLLKEENESIISTLKSDLATLKVEHNDLHSLFKDKVKKENLQKQVLHLRGDFQKEDAMTTAVEKGSSEGNARAAYLDTDTKINTRNRSSGADFICNCEEVGNLENKVKLIEEAMSLKCRMDGFQAIEEEDLEILLDPNSREKRFTCGLNGMDQDSTVSNLGYSSKVDDTLTGFPCDQGNLAEMLIDISNLRETNKSMQEELKEMQERYSEISLKFAEVEGERQQLVMTVRTLKNALKN